MLKAAQVAVFFIIVVFIIASTSLVILVYKPANNDLVLQHTASEQPISLFVDSCLRETTKDGIYYISSQGGYYKPAQAQPFENRDVAVYLDSGKYFVPTVFAIEQELSYYINENMHKCIDDFKSLTSMGYSITQSNISTKITIGENDITAFASYPVTISQGRSTRILEDFSVSIPFSFKDVYKIIQDVMIEQGDDSLAIHYGFLAESAYDNDYVFEIVEIDENTLVYSLQFDSTSLNTDTYKFNFAANYDW